MPIFFGRFGFLQGSDFGAVDEIEIIAFQWAKEINQVHDLVVYLESGYANEAKPWVSVRFGLL